MNTDMGNQQLFTDLRRDFSQKCDATKIRLYALWDEKNRGHVNTDLDIQRSYQWTSDQEQEMWDTLLLNVRIPEFHAIMDGLIYNICDGKQRLTCIFKILNNELSYKRAKANNACKWLFTKLSPKTGKPIQCPEIFFRDLPQEIQNEIFNTTVTIAQYTNLNRIEQIMLFRKINNGKALSDFAKGLAANYFMRNDYSQYIMQHHNLQACQFLRGNPEAVEKMTIRALLLCSNVENLTLVPQNMHKYYCLFEDNEYMEKMRQYMLNVLDRIPNLPALSGCLSWESIVPFLLWGIYTHPNLTPDQISELCNKLRNYHSGTHRDLNANRVNELKNYINQVIATL